MNLSKYFILVFTLVITVTSCTEKSCTEPASIEEVPADAQFRYVAAPVPVNWKNKIILGYEIQGLGFFNSSFEVKSVELLKENESGKLIAAYSGESLSKIYLPQSKSNVTRGAVIFLWPEFHSITEVPDTIYHKILLSNGVTEKVFSVKTPVNKINPIIIQPPVRGKNWLCGNGPSNDLFNYHRTSIITIQTIPFVS